MDRDFGRRFDTCASWLVKAFCFEESVFAPVLSDENTHQKQTDQSWARCDQLLLGLLLGLVPQRPKSGSIRPMLVRLENGSNTCWADSNNVGILARFTSCRCSRGRSQQLSREGAACGKAMQRRSASNFGKAHGGVPACLVPASRRWQSRMDRSRGRPRRAGKGGAAPSGVVGAVGGLLRPIMGCRGPAWVAALHVRCGHLLACAGAMHAADPTHGLRRPRAGAAAQRSHAEDRRTAGK